jgi:hypothetical protein
VYFVKAFLRTLTVSPKSKKGRTTTTTFALLDRNARGDNRIDNNLCTMGKVVVVFLFMALLAIVVVEVSVVDYVVAANDLYQICTSTSHRFAATAATTAAATTIKANL